MAVIVQQISIPSNQSSATVFTSTPTNSSAISIRNTGSVTVLLGNGGSILFPLAANEVLGVSVGFDDTLEAKVQTSGTAGQLTILGMD